jgi:ribosomal protein S18 acetylase RimI-like enzyme
LPAGGIWICRKRLTGGGGMEGEYNIYRAGPRDLAEIWPLWCQMYQELDQYSPWFPLAPDFELFGKRFLAHVLSDSSQVVFVAKRGQETVSFLTGGEWTPAGLFQRRRHLYINDLYVASQHRRQGLARRLLEQAGEWAKQRGFEYISLGVLADNPALGFYRREGFAVHRVSMIKKLI